MAPTQVTLKGLKIGNSKHHFGRGTDYLVTMQTCTWGVDLHRKPGDSGAEETGREGGNGSRVYNLYLEKLPH